MTINLWGRLAAAGALLCLLFATTARADVTNGYCATFDPATGTLDVPSLIVNGSAYSVSLQLTSAAPITLQLTGIAASGLASALGQSATFNTANSTMSIPCVVLNGTKFWTVFNVAMGGNITATLSKSSSGVPASCSPLTQPPAGVTVEVVPNGGITGYVANAYVTNNSGQQECFCAQPCMGLRNSASGSQSIALIRTGMMCIANGAQGTIPVYGSCENAPLHPPSPSERFTFFEDARADLCAFTQTLERESTEDFWMGSGTVLLGIWAITDDFPVPPPYLSNIRALFQQAGLDPNAYPGLNLYGSPMVSSGSKADKLLASPR